MPESYESGVADGKIIERLDGHDRHFARINGSIEALAKRMGNVELLLQQIIDKADFRFNSASAAQDARDATVASVAIALEKKEEARRDTSSQRWTPIQRVLAVLVALATLIGAVVTIIATR